MEHWKIPDTCPNCGEYLIGDGYSNGDPVRCPEALEEDWWYSEPDSGRHKGQTNAWMMTPDRRFIM